MARLDKEREQELQPKRMEYVCSRLRDLGIEYTFDNTKVCFQWKGLKVTVFPYSGWHSGKSIIDGRGIDNLLKQLK